MLQSLRLENFKAWADTGQIQTAPLTLLFGPNSSGKSSINHFLMLLKETVRSPDRNNVFDFGEGSSAAPLGSFRDVVFRHDMRRTLKFELEWLLDAPIDIRDPRSRQRHTGDQLRFRAAVRQPARSRTVQSEGFEYALKGLTGEVAVAMLRDDKRTNRWRLKAENYTLVRRKGRAWELPRPVQFYGFPSEASVYFQNSAFLADLELALQRELQGVSYLGPLRSPPLPMYSWSGGVPEDVGWRGESTIQALLASSARQFNWRAKEKLQSFEQVTASWLKAMHLIDSFSVAEIAPGRDLFDVRVRVGPKSEEVRLTDVGFGVSQVLPVVVQLFHAPAHSTVLIEQPELHLHPAAQGALADLFIAAVTARESGRPRGVQVIAESHSEHLLRRLQRRVAEGSIDSDRVALYFCHQTPQGSVIERLELNLFGEIANWPPDFFGDDLEDVVVQTELALNERIKGRT
jgi:predicted ATPase